MSEAAKYVLNSYSCYYFFKNCYFRKSLFSLKKSVATLEPKTPLPIASAFGHDSDDDDDAPKDPKEMFYKTYGSTKAYVILIFNSFI